ncbi:MAG TPA: hypothetical protein VG269_25685 [Tepidisphaeraceae bacterium]|nr:hypothetical protein [Tepidisphaeraceae bacterium]
MFDTPEQVARFGPRSGILRGGVDLTLHPSNSRMVLSPRAGADQGGGAYAIIPDWCIALPLLLLIPVAWRIDKVLRMRRRRLRSECVVCGYDLRATPGRCPECGTMPAAEKVNV